MSLLPQAASHHLYTRLLDQVLRMSAEKVLGGERTFEDRTIMVEELPATDCAVLSWWGPPHACAHMLATFGPWRDEAPWKGPGVCSARDASRPHLSCCWHRAQQSLISRGPCPVEIRKKKVYPSGAPPIQVLLLSGHLWGNVPNPLKAAVCSGPVSVLEIRVHILGQLLCSSWYFWLGPSCTDVWGGEFVAWARAPGLGMGTSDWGPLPPVFPLFFLTADADV